MKTIFVVIFCIAIVTILLFFVLGILSKQGQALGLIDGNLSPCFNKPNCVCSEQASHIHYITPISFNPKSELEALAILKNIIQSMDGKIQQNDDDYIAATFSSTIFGFVDDLEIRMDSNHYIIHIRSASRVGHGDMGVNKKRVEQLKQLYHEQVGEH